MKPFFSQENSQKNSQEDLISEINELKKRKNAVILVHNYQRPEIYKIADFIGDSLGLCQQAGKTDADIILFCGVLFMAETAAILNPDKKVVIPYLDAGCAMADMINADQLRDFKGKHPDAAVVCYVNSTAEVKAESDVCCTSSNAVDVVRGLDAEEILFVPDRNLAAYVQSKVPEKKIIPWEGFCPVHNSLTVSYIQDARKNYPNAKILAHPECRPDVLKCADHITSTSGMINAAKNDSADEFFVLTECGMTERLNIEVPQKKFYGFCNMCFDMKKITLESVLKSLNSEKPVVTVDPEVSKKAKNALDRMFELTNL